jgi:dehydrogenase/reductase SDR family protein 4
LQKYGRIDILISNAAVNPSVDPILTMSEKALDKLWEINLKASVQIVQVN